MLSPHVSAPLAVVALCGSVVAGATTTVTAPAEKRTFNLPRGDAAVTLKQFAATAGTPIVYLVDRVRGVTTHAVSGDFAPREALELMLAGSVLEAAQDAATGALVVSRKHTAEIEPRTGEVGPVSGPQRNPKANPMKFPRTLLASLAGWLTFGASADAQSASSPPSAAGGAIELSPFVVSSEKDEGYQAQNTLSGSRLNSSLANTPVAIQVLTKELLLDLNATNYEGYLNFATNSGRDFSDVTGAVSIQQGNNQVRIRGFTGAAMTRDFFPSSTRSDRFSIDRYEVSRGPNSILFGIGGPGGVVNTGSKVALVNSNQKDEVRITFGSWNNRRAELDFNRTLLPRKLAVRANFLLEDKEGWRDYELEKRLGAAIAATWQPWSRTQVRMNYEYVDTKQNQAYPFPSADTSGSWIAAGKPIASGPITDLATTAPAGTVSSFSDGIRYAPQVSPNAYRYGDTRVVDADPVLPGVQRVRFFETPNAPNSPVGGVVSYINFAVLPERANLAGPGNRSDNRYGLFSLFLEQRAGPLAIELAYNRQEDFWRSNFPINSLVLGMRGDANPQLPGYYLPTGTLGANPPGQVIATPFRPNSFAGQFYVEGQSAFRIQRRVTDNFRATVSLGLDLRKRGKWLGHHQIAALAQRSDSEYYTDIFTEYNLARDNTLGFNSAPNAIIRRTYVDFTTPGAPRGAHDPFSNPISSPGVQPGYLRNAQTNRQRGITDSTMAVVQSNIIHDLLVLTLGARRDTQANNRAGGGMLLPAAGPLGGTWTEDTIYYAARETKFSGNTYTRGAVLRPLKWVSLVYNASNSVRPSSFINIFGETQPPQEGVGEDYGLRFFLFDSRISLGLTRYDTNNLNGNYDGITTRTVAFPVITGIYQAFADAGISSKYTAGQFFSGFRDLASSDGKGWEAELTANPTNRWRISANYSRADLALANVQQDVNRLLRAESPFWRQNTSVPYLTRDGNLESFIRVRDNTPARDFVLNPATVGDAQQLVQQVLDGINLQEGQLPLQHQRDSFNFFNSYSFAKLPLLGTGFTAGFGASYRSAAVIGYANNLPIYGKSYTLWNGMLRKRFTLERQRMLDLQLNMNNLFRQHDLLPFSATAAGVNRWFLQRQRQSWTLQATLSF